MTAFTATLGLPQPGYLPGLPQAPAPRHPSLRKSRPLTVQRDRTPPLSRADPATVQRAGAVVGGLAAALCQLDHCARQLQGLGQMQHQAKAKLSQLVTLSDEVLAAASRTFDFQDADAINALSEVLGQAAELLLQLRPDQIEAGLKHLHNMATSNLAYVPATV